MRFRPTITTRQLAPLGPAEQLRAGRLPRRLLQLVAGLALLGASLAMVLRATLGNAPWDVLHQGLAIHLPITLGTAIVLASLVVLVAWVPLRERPGLGTVANALLVGPFADLTLAVLAAPSSPWARGLLLVIGIVLNALATALYIGAQLGPGPRDGLMTGLHRRTGWGLGPVRTAIELVVVATGWVLGGIVGLGTVLFAFTIGPLVGLLVPVCVVDLPGLQAPEPPAAS